jgi:hypothetical protein
MCGVHDEEVFADERSFVNLFFFVTAQANLRPAESRLFLLRAPILAPLVHHHDLGAPCERLSAEHQPVAPHQKNHAIPHGPMMRVTDEWSQP